MDTDKSVAQTCRFAGLSDMFGCRSEVELTLCSLYLNGQLNSGGLLCKLQKMETGFRRVDPASVDFSDRTISTFEPFHIGTREVSIAEYAEFCGATSYRTLFEKDGEHDCYFRNRTTDGMSDENKLKLPACYLSVEDAQAYCDWRKVRLPTDDELIVAAVFKVLPADANSSDLLTEMINLRGVVSFSICDGLEFTASMEAGRSVARSGPQYAMLSQTTFDDGRHLVSDQFADITTKFRVCQII